MESSEFITFFKPGIVQCPKCGMMGNEKKHSDIKYFKCPGCDTEYTHDIIINMGEKEIELENN